MTAPMSIDDTKLLTFPQAVAKCLDWNIISRACWQKSMDETPFCGLAVGLNKDSGKKELIIVWVPGRLQEPLGPWIVRPDNFFASDWYVVGEHTGREKMEAMVVEGRWQ